MKLILQFSRLFILALLLINCGSTKLIQQYKNPDTAYFQANKVLVVGISAEKELRRNYEKKDDR